MHDSAGASTMHPSPDEQNQPMLPNAHFSEVGWRGRRCLVTGAGGFIGTALCRNLAALEADVHAVSRSSRRFEHCTLTSCDVTDLQQVRSVFRDVRPEVVFHLASTVSGSRSIDLVLPTLTSTISGTVHVLLAAAEFPARVVCLGSLQEPDNQIRGVPPSPYAAAKFAAGAYARMFSYLYGVQVDVARPFMVYGPGQMDFTKLVPYVLSRVLQGDVAELSSGAQAFDWVYVDDVVDALLATAIRGSGDGGTIDVGCGALTPVRDVALGLAIRAGSERLLKFGSVEDRRLEPTRSADLNDTEARIGWRPKVTLDEGLSRTVDWYRAHFAAARPS